MLLMHACLLASLLNASNSVFHTLSPYVTPDVGAIRATASSSSGSYWNLTLPTDDEWSLGQAMSWEGKSSKYLSRLTKETLLAESAQTRKERSSATSRWVKLGLSWTATTSEMEQGMIFTMVYFHLTVLETALASPMWWLGDFRGKIKFKLPRNHLVYVSYCLLVRVCKYRKRVSLH